MLAFDPVFEAGDAFRVSTESGVSTTINVPDGLVVPAHILAHQSASTSVFVTSMHDKPYVIDPMTFVFQNPKEAHLNDAGEIRPSIQKLCDAYDNSLAKRILPRIFAYSPYSTKVMFSSSSHRVRGARSRTSRTRSRTVRMKTSLPAPEP